MSKRYLKYLGCHLVLGTTKSENTSVKKPCVCDRSIQQSKFIDCNNSCNI